MWCTLKEERVVLRGGRRTEKQAGRGVREVREMGRKSLAPQGAVH